MDKVKVNNQVVKMRKHVKRARLLAINKFTKQIKLLQNKKASDSQAEKNKRKVERFMEKIKILKKMVPDVVSKKALSKAKDWKAVLAQKNIPLEDQCLALLANDNEVQREVEKFHTNECELAAKIPSLLLEWEMKSKMPKSPDKKKTASDIKRQKMEKIAKRKKSNFKGATFPNNVAVNKPLKASDNKKERSSDHDQEGNSTDKNQIVSQSINHSIGSVSEKLLAETVKSRHENSEPTENNSDENDFSDSAGDSGASESEEFFTKVVKNNGNQKQSFESIDDDSNENDNLDSGLSDNSSDGNSEVALSDVQKEEKYLLLKKGGGYRKKHVLKAEEPKSRVNLSCEEDKDDNSNDMKNNLSDKFESNENPDTCPQPSIFERLNALAKTDTKKLKTKHNKSNSASQNTKAIKVLDLNELQDTDEIPIQTIPVNPQEPNDAPQTVVPKKDSFFLNGDEEVQSSEDEESNVNNFRDFKPKRKFSNFNQNDKGNKFMRNSFEDKSHKPFGSFKDRSFNKNESKFQNKREKPFNRNENRFQNRKGNDFNQNESRFQKKAKGNSQFNDRKKFNAKSKEGFHPVKQQNPAKMNDSSHFKRENKKSKMDSSFHSKKQTNEKEEINAHLHPSWEAKKKLKEASKSGFQGKRMVFD